MNLKKFNHLFECKQISKVKKLLASVPKVLAQYKLKMGQGPWDEGGTPGCSRTRHTWSPCDAGPLYGQ